MLRRNPTRIELCSDDRDELEEHRRAAAGSTPAATIKDPPGYTTPSPVLGPQTSNPLLRLLHPPPDGAPSKAQRIGIGIGLSTPPAPGPAPRPHNPPHGG
ncbi:uncharacterized protein LOC110432911 [Sorghum bicolor]|uniref:uncharacterized protein LOC110432911 n=1 Tax=Sorghum bicolor TaxID=4558 RepID=UPI000B423FC9|nr:uncharacterized protein LOC110432911 [Sorghum bicolor]|eukprot:XP_021309795.1 uncharacterized protein LOC110432911 [Sorghum bicolor]